MCKDISQGWLLSHRGATLPGAWERASRSMVGGGSEPIRLLTVSDRSWCCRSLQDSHTIFAAWAPYTLRKSWKLSSFQLMLDNSGNFTLHLHAEYKRFLTYCTIGGGKHGDNRRRKTPFWFYKKDFVLKTELVIWEPNYFFLSTEFVGWFCEEH